MPGGTELPRLAWRSTDGSFAGICMETSAVLGEVEISNQSRTAGMHSSGKRDACL